MPDPTRDDPSHSSGREAATWPAGATPSANGAAFGIAFFKERLRPWQALAFGLALVAVRKGYKLVLVMPESMSVERRRLMLAYGASFVLTPREKGMNGAIESKCEEIAIFTAASEARNKVA